MLWPNLAVMTSRSCPVLDSRHSGPYLKLNSQKGWKSRCLQNQNRESRAQYKIARRKQNRYRIDTSRFPLFYISNILLASSVIQNWDGMGEHNWGKIYGMARTAEQLWFRLSGQREPDMMIMPAWHPRWRIELFCLWQGNFPGIVSYFEEIWLLP